jgi:broad specificity phosphatase PhoE
MAADTVSVVFETHSISEDNERGLATGWLPGRLSPRGRALAAELGARRRADGLAAAFSSDLRRAVETVEIALGGTPVPIFHDWRLRECDYGELNGMPTARLHAGWLEHLDQPYPGGESWRQAVARVQRALDDLAAGWPGRRVLVVGHRATLWALEERVHGRSLHELASTEFVWQPGWEYELRVPVGGPSGLAAPS